MSINPEKRLFAVAVRTWNTARTRGKLNYDELIELAIATDTLSQKSHSERNEEFIVEVGHFLNRVDPDESIHIDLIKQFGRAIDDYAQAKSKPKIYDWQTRADCGDPDLTEPEPAPTHADRSKARLLTRGGSGAARNAAACNPEKQIKAVDLGEQTRRRNPDPVIDCRFGREVPR